jgi:hypothetical protein
VNSDSKAPKFEELEQASKDFATAYDKAQQLIAGDQRSKADVLIGKATQDWLRSRAKTDPALRSQLQAAQKQVVSKVQQEVVPK